MSYIENLLAGAKVEWKHLGDICEIKTGKGVTKRDSSESGAYPIISGGKGPMGFINKFNRSENAVTISRVGANAGYVNYISKKFYLNDKCFSVIPIDLVKNEINSKYLYYLLKSTEQNIIALQSEGGVPTINTGKVSNLQIPIPPLDVQNKIVDILNSFEELNALLTAELTSRKKQYEYYRDLLLKFPQNNLET